MCSLWHFPRMSVCVLDGTVLFFLDVMRRFISFPWYQSVADRESLGRNYTKKRSTLCPSIWFCRLWLISFEFSHQLGGDNDAVASGLSLSCVITTDISNWISQTIFFFFRSFHIRKRIPTFPRIRDNCRLKSIPSRHTGGGDLSSFHGSIEATKTKMDFHVVEC